MKRIREESAKEGGGPPIYRQAVASPQAFAGGAAKALSEVAQPALYAQAQGAYAALPAPPLAGGKPLSATSHNAMRVGASPPSGPQDPHAQQQQPSPSNFQRLKVEDALSYLDLVKYKFGSKPQVYNDFLDIMKEFKSQSIDTPGVIERVSSLFKGFPELIVGFNTFLPPGYKIEVQRSEQGGYAFSVSVSVPNPSAADQQKSAMILSGSGRINVSAPALAPPPPALTLAQPQPPVAVPVPAPAPALVPPAVGAYALSAPPTYGLSLSAAQAAVNHALQGHADAPQNQPVEFNHAINYVNKIKNRFQGQPEKYKRFLEILHTYQKEQRTMKESNVATNVKHLTEQEVYSQVAKLFENQGDLLAEFGQFLPDATSHINQPGVAAAAGAAAEQQQSNSIGSKKSLKPYHLTADRHKSGSVKRSPPYSGYHRDVPPPKKPKISPAYRDVSLSEAGKYGTLNDYAFFDKVRKALRSHEVYSNFLRCLVLFNQEIVSKTELLQIVTPFLGKFPELLKWFREFMGQNDQTEPVPYNVARSDRAQGEHVLEIDLATAKRLGASYCVIPKAQEGQKCSGRTALCKEVLNDQWVSFPTWSEDSTFVSSRKTQYEEYMYRCEDERFELDVVIETNASTIRVLEAVQKKLGRMGGDEVAKFKLDDCLGGASPTLHQRALRRIYGDKAQDMIEGLKKSPAVAVPVVLKRLKMKEDEWREAQKGFNKIWREQNEKYYLKSLDHMGINFKQTDVKAIRTKSLFNEIETLFDERHEQNDEGGETVAGPHLIIPYRDKGILDDAANLLIHHVKRQTGIQKGEKRKIKQLLRQFVPDLFFHARQPLSDDEREEDDDNNEEKSSGSPKNSHNDSKEGKTKREESACASSSADVEDSSPEVKSEPDAKEEDVKLPLHAQTANPDEAYTLFMANNSWYVFFRLHAILCERLLRVYERAVKIAQEERKNGETRKTSTAIALRLKPKPQIEYDEYYPAFLDMVKNLLDGNMEANAYEDTLREMFGIHAYVAFTLDKVVSYAVRQLQHCVTERTAIGCTELYLKEHKRGAAGGRCATAYRRIYQEQAYQRAAEKVVQEENCFKIYIYKCDCKITIELLDTEPEDSKKAEEANKWNSYKERFASVANSTPSKVRSPVYLTRNVKQYKRQHCGKKSRTCSPTTDKDQSVEASLNMFEALERKLNERAAPERHETSHPGYQVQDEQECKFGPKITFTLTKDSFLYKNRAFSRARLSHAQVTKRKASKFGAWLKRWTSAHVSDAHASQCADWLMGRGEGVVPNRTRVCADNDVRRAPYAPYNRYRVDRLGGGGDVNNAPA